MSQIPELYRACGYPEWIESLRQSLPEASLLCTELFKWVIVLGTGALTYVGVWIFAWLLECSMIGRALAPGARAPIARFLRGAFGIWLVVLVMTSATNAPGRTETADLIRRFSPVSTIVAVWMLFVLVKLLRDLWGADLERQGRPAARVLLEPAATTLQLLIFVAAVLVYLDNIGVNITTALAGLGVGGVAVALALQKPMEDIFGAVTLYAQQSIRIGDFCRIGDRVGTIEEIALRPTRVRTLQNSLINIPNAKLAAEPIDNISARHKILFRQRVLLRRNTSAEQMRTILTGIERLLQENDNVLEEGARARFTRVAREGLEIEVFAYVDTRDWLAFLRFGQELNLATLDIVANAGADLAAPILGRGASAGSKGQRHSRARRTACWLRPDDAHLSTGRDQGASIAASCWRRGRWDDSRTRWH